MVTTDESVMGLAPHSLPSRQLRLHKTQEEGSLFVPEQHMPVKSWTPTSAYVHGFGLHSMVNIFVKQNATVRMLVLKHFT